MQKGNHVTARAVLRRLHFFVALFAVLAVVFFARQAKAEPAWCIKEVSRSDSQVVVLHNPECDLRVLPRMYPLRDAAGKVLPTQVQLRSIYAANQTRVVDGVKVRYTVMRACVRPGKPSADADEEEKQICPDGLMNYFSAPSDDSAAKIVIPFERELTPAESYLALAEIACARLQNKPLATDEDKASADACKSQFPKMVFNAAAAPVNPAPGSAPEVSGKPSALLEAENQAFKAQVNELAPKAEKAKFILPMFGLIVGLALFAAVGILLTYHKSKKLTQARKEIADLEFLLAEAKEASRIALAQKDKEHAKKLQEAEAKSKKLSDKAEKLKEDLKQVREQTEKDLQGAWHQKLNDQQQEIAALRARATEADQQIADVQGKLKAADQQVEELREENLQLTARGTALERQLASLHAELDVLSEPRAPETRPGFPLQDDPDDDSDRGEEPQTPEDDRVEQSLVRSLQTTGIAGQGDSGMPPEEHRHSWIVKALHLQNGDMGHQTMNSLSDFTHEELFRMMMAALKTTVHRFKNGEFFELPVTSMEDLAAMRGVMMLPLAGWNSFALPSVFAHLANGGEPRVYHLIDQAFEGIGADQGTQAQQTLRPAAGDPAAS